MPATSSSNYRRQALAYVLGAMLVGAAGKAAATTQMPLPATSFGAAAHLRDTDLLRADTRQGNEELKPGEFRWLPGSELDTGAPVMVMVSIAEQRAYVYRDGQPIAVTTVSTGKPGHDTPTGVFQILQKQKMHHSNLYENDRTGAPAPMPWMQRLTWDGVALHAGHVRAKPASHGCVRLPPEFARQLYAITDRGGLVVISEDGSIEALSQAGVDAPLALLMSSASSLQGIARKFMPEGAAPALASRSAP